MEENTIFNYLGLRARLTPQVVDIEDLYLDPENPRLFGEDVEITPGELEGCHWSDPRAQWRLFRALEKSHGVQALIDSLASLGYVPMDKMVVREALPGKFMLIEGNRRTVAMQRLLHDNMRRARKDPEEVLATFRKIEVLVLTSTDADQAKDIFLLQGIRHIAGVRNWGPYQ